MSRKRRYRAEQYIWLLTADPPICRSGRPLEVLDSCERRRRDLVCWCRVAVRDIADDLDAVGCGDLADEFEAELDSDDVAELAERLASVGRTAEDREAGERVAAAAEILERIAEAGSGLSDRHADDVDA